MIFQAFKSYTNDMAIYVEVRVREIVLDDGSYKVSAIVEVAYNVSKALFVYRADTDLFSHVATVLDIKTLPDNRAAVVGQTSAIFYRLTTVEQIFTTKDKAAAFSKAINDRLSITIAALNREENVTFGEDKVLRIGQP